MKNTIPILLCVLGVTAMQLGPQRGFAQVPSVSVYFDEIPHYWYSPDCPGDDPIHNPIAGTVFVVAENFPSPFVQLEYKIDFPEQMWFLEDYIRGGSAVGHSSTGIIQTWETPQNASSHLVVNEVLFVWDCDGCNSVQIPVCVDSHPGTGYLRAVSWPEMEPVYATSYTAIICFAFPSRPPCPITPPVPVEGTTWGAIKALYQQ